MVSGVWLGAQEDKHDLNIAGEAAASIAFWVGLVGTCVFASRRKGRGTLAEDFGLRFQVSDVPVGIAVGIAAQLVLIPGIAFLMRPFIGHPDVSGPVQDMIERANGGRLAGLVLFVVVGAPAVEELFFRGLLLRSFVRRFGPVGAIPLSGALFGLAHTQDVPGDAQLLIMVSLAALGCVFGWLALRTGRIGPTIVAHATFNLWTLIFVAFF